MQPNGATVWARKTIQSEIFATKPDKWFKIWFYLVNRANYKDNAYKRGECFIPSGEIETMTGATKDQVKKCLTWLRDKHSISTRRSTRGIHLKVNKYGIYQDLSAYSSTREAPEKHQRSTTIGEVSKKVNNISEQSSVTSNSKDMTFNKYNDNDDVSTIDYDSNEPLEEETTKVNTETKERNKKIRHNIRYAFTALELKPPDPKQVNWQLKHYQTLLDRGWSHEQIVENFIHIVGSDHWREKMDNGENPGFHTVEYTLRSKDPEKYVIKS